jgi:Fe-S-cluster-containing dehydrogenase component
MQPLEEYDWAQVEGYQVLKPFLELIVGPAGLRDKQTSDEKQNFFTMGYRPREIVMPKGVFGEFAALLLRGSVEAFDVTPDLGSIRSPSDGCWSRPGVLGRLWTHWTGLQVGLTERKMDAPRPSRKARRSWGPPKARITTADLPEDRFMGVSSSLWNQRRSLTLVAGENGCDLLLMKRLQLQKLVKTIGTFRDRVTQRFRTNELPRLLAENLLFKGMNLSAAAGWAQWVATAPIDLIHYLKDPEAKGLAVFPPAPGPSASVPARVVYPPDHSGRLMICTAPETKKEAHGPDTAAPTQADGLYLILSGVVRITRRLQSGEVLLRQHERNGFFGFTADDVEAVTDVHVARMTWDTVADLENCYPQVRERLQRHRQHWQERDRQLLAGRSLPPEEPPEEVATKLLVATNLLRIDMDLCTRCDQCVVACAETHKGVPRFHRANPNLRFGKWEIPRACVHCSDAPCQVVCPVGAITFLEDGIVQIHHDRCIGCQKCPSACPFDVIEMYPPAGPADVPALPDKRREIGVATKCDRCLTMTYEPACVAACPYGASERGSPLTLFPQLRRWAEPVHTEGG